MGSKILMSGIVLLGFGLCGVVLSTGTKDVPHSYKVAIVLCIIGGAIAIPVGAIISIWS